MPPTLPLVDDLMEEVLLRFPPEDPAALVHAALVCKRWRRLVSNPGFRRRFCEFHRTPPMLGSFCSDRSHLCAASSCPRPPSARVMPSTPRSACWTPATAVSSSLGGYKALVVWDPITDEEWKVPFPRVTRPYKSAFSWTAAVLCSAAEAGGCDHLDCHHRPFIVVFVSIVVGKPDEVYTVIWTYSSDAATWSESTFSFSGNPFYRFNPLMRSVFVGNTLYFGILNKRTALKYNVQLRQMSWIHLPSSVPRYRQTLLTTTEDGGLGLAAEHESKLYIWSMKDTTWEQSRVIELKMLLPVDADFTSLEVVGSMDGLGIIVIRANNAVYTIDLNTYKGKKVYEGRVEDIVLFTSFYTPELEATYVGEGPSEGGSSA